MSCLNITTIESLFLFKLVEYKLELGSYFFKGFKIIWFSVKFYYLSS